ncbi:adenosylcobinamide-phosphate synthase CbiB [Clostridium ganghwense]|uniref:Cobalamin biosynthesis protein CobD n=1 Tax=Clostridium ganghwense TaxID=312089 RepID=A0ABT4CUQ9_9CLOT|nr:adenosylcobinamide-phosphate synthase CbiB [Clostridium ganghwense]MCY6372178.1 adenosylcobinamide-phosphate synthase CbiB [Clostridium ganghwense]
MIDIALAVVIDWIIGDPYWFPHPVIYMGKLIRFLENLGRKHFKKDNQLKMYGLFIVIAVASVSFLVPFGILKLTKGIPWLYHSLNVLILWTTLAARCLHKEAKKVHDSLAYEGIEEARIKVSYIVGRDTSQLSEHEIIRADVETVAENASDGIIAPLLYAMIGGAPLAMLYKGINTMDSMLGYMDEKYRYIGYFTAKIDDVFNLIPARITGILMCISAPLVKGNIIESFRIMIRDRKNHKSPNCAYPEGAAAGALEIQLGGTNSYFGNTVYKPTIGDSKKELDKRHIIDVIKLMYGTEVLTLLIYFAICYS